MVGREAEISEGDEGGDADNAFIAGLSLPLFLAAVVGALALCCCLFAMCFFVSKKKSAKKNSKRPGTARRSRAHSGLSRSGV